MVGGGGGRHDVFIGVNPNDPTRESLNFRPGPPELFNRALLISYIILVGLLFRYLPQWLEGINIEQEIFIWIINAGLFSGYAINRFQKNLSFSNTKTAFVSLLAYPIMGYFAYHMYLN